MPHATVFKYIFSLCLVNFSHFLKNNQLLGQIDTPPIIDLEGSGNTRLKPSGQLCNLASSIPVPLLPSEGQPRRLDAQTTMLSALHSKAEKTIIQNHQSPPVKPQIRADSTPSINGSLAHQKGGNIHSVYHTAGRQKIFRGINHSGCMAEREGFEPSVRLLAQRFSRPPRSTAPAPLRRSGLYACFSLACKSLSAFSVSC